MQSSVALTVAVGLLPWSSALCPDIVEQKAQLEATDCNGMTPAHCAVDANQLEMVKFALESGANVEARDACDWTLLMRAGELSLAWGHLK